MKIVNEGSTPSELAALGILNQFFDGEENGSAKAYALHKEFARRMSVCTMSEEVVGQVVMQIFIDLKLRLDRTAGQVECIGGERRDVLRGRS